LVDSGGPLHIYNSSIFVVTPYTKKGSCEQKNYLRQLPTLFDEVVGELVVRHSWAKPADAERPAASSWWVHPAKRSTSRRCQISPVITLLAGAEAFGSEPSPDQHDAVAQHADSERRARSALVAASLLAVESTTQLVRRTVPPQTALRDSRHSLRQGGLLQRHAGTRPEPCHHQLRRANTIVTPATLYGRGPSSTECGNASPRRPRRLTCSPTACPRCRPGCSTRSHWQRVMVARLSRGLSLDCLLSRPLSGTRSQGVAVV